jgi:uncharacterized protein with GYD domain
MPKYVAFFSYTNEAWRRMIENPADRAAAARAVIESVGGTMECFYWMTGDDDGLVIFEAPDVALAGATAAGVASSGLVTGLHTHELLDMEQAAVLLSGAGRIQGVYPPRGPEPRARRSANVRPGRSGLNRLRRGRAGHTLPVQAPPPDRLDPGGRGGE